MYIFSFNDCGKIISEKKIGASEIISSDTSGFWILEDNIILPCNDEIILINALNFEIIWRKKVSGFVGRHVVISDEKNIYYTTLRGKIGSIDIKTGNINWEISTQEGLIFSPPSLSGNTLFVLADCMLYLIDKQKGSVYFRKVIGHAPYSAPVIFKNHLFIGGGEPPIYGVLLCYEMKNNLKELKNKEGVIKTFEVGNYVENDKMQLSIILDEKVKNILLDVSVISNEKLIKPTFEKENNYIFEFELKKNNASGLYSLPITFEKNKKIKSEMVVVNLILKKPKLKRVRLNEFYKEVLEETAFHSGAALSQAILKKYKKDISQTEFRKIIDHVKKKSEWKDADFQTWRLILKRVLSTPANSIESFLEKEIQNEK